MTDNKLLGTEVRRVQSLPATSEHSRYLRRASWWKHSQLDRHLRKNSIPE